MMNGDFLVIKQGQKSRQVPHEQSAEWEGCVQRPKRLLIALESHWLLHRRTCKIAVS